MNAIILLGLLAAAGDEPARRSSAGSALLADPMALLEQQDRLRERQPSGTDAERFGVQEPLPLNPDTGKQVRATPADTWLYFALSPYRGLRNNAWHGLFNTPALEEALALPKGTWHPYLTIDHSSSDWTSDDEGGSSAFKTGHVSQVFGMDYAVSGWFLLGLKLTTGELGEGDEETVRLYDSGQQLIERGERGYGIESLTARAKYAFSFGPLDFALLAEVKVPLADEEDLLTSQTLDVGVSAIITKRWRSFALHFNIGAVFPEGDPEVFLANDDADAYLHGGIALGWLAFSSFSFTAQLEFNTSPFSSIALLDENVLAASLGGRYKVGRNLFVSGAAGIGLTEDSGDLFLSTGLDMTF